MAQPTIKLEYLNSSDVWVEALTHAGNSAVLICKIFKILNNPTTAELYLTNKSKDYAATDATAKGNLTDIFSEATSDYMDCRLTDNETGTIIFRGKVYEIKNQYDFQYGSTIKVTLKNALQELADYPIDDAPPSLKNINLTTYNSRSKIIQRLATQLTVDGFDFSDTAKFESSIENFTDGEKKTGIQDDDLNYLWDISSGRQFALQIIHDFATHDPHNAEDNGFDYYIDAGITSHQNAGLAGSTNIPNPSFYYGKRGTKPGANQNATADPTTHGLILEYPSAGWGGANNQRRPMHHDAEFNSPKNELYTNIVAHFEDTGEGDQEQAGDAEQGQARKIVASYEIIGGTLANFATGGSLGNEWSEKKLHYRTDGALNNTTGQSENNSNPLLLYRSGATYPCATLHYSTGNGAGNIMVSNIYDQPDTTGGTTVLYTDDVGGTQTFEPWSIAALQGDSNVTIYTHKSGGSNPNLTFVPNTGRPSLRFKMKRPLRIQLKGIDSYDKLREEMHAKLDKVGQDTITKANVKLSRYPYSKFVAAAANVSRTNNVLTFSNNAWSNVAGNVNTNDVRTFGVRKGMVIAELDSGGAVARFGFISGMSSTTITYGGVTSPTGEDTSDGTALDTTKDMGVFVFVEPGHTVRVKNKVWGKNYDILIQKLEYVTQPGVLLATVEGVGVDNGINVPGVPPNIVQSSVSGSSDKGYTVNIPSGQQKWTISDGLIRAKDHDEIEVVSTSLAATGATTTGTSNVKTYVTIVTADGKRYKMNTTAGLSIAGANGTAGQPHVLYFRPSGYQSSANLQTKAAKSTDALNSTPNEVYSQIQVGTDIVIGWATIDTDTSGKASLQLNGVASGSFGQIDVAAIADNRITASLLKKGAQPFTTTVLFKEFPTGSSSVYNKIQWLAGAISFGESATDTATIDAATSDQDFTSAGGVNISSGMSTGTYYVFYTIGGSTLAITTDYLVPFQDNKVLLATVVVDSDPSGTNYSPTILPYNGKLPTISAVSMAANAITADNITALTITGGKIAGTTIEAGKLTAGAISTVSLHSANTIRVGVTPENVSGNMTGITMTSAGNIYSTYNGAAKSTFLDTDVGYFLGFDTSSPAKPVFNIGDASSYFKWDGSDVKIAGTIEGATKILLGGSGIDSGGGGNTAAGQLGMLDTNNALAFRIRSHVSYVQMDVLGRAMWLVISGSGTANFVAPGAGNGATYLGTITDGGSSPNNYGVGWRALTLGRTTHDGALVLQSHATTTNQYTFTFPQAPSGTNGYVLTADGTSGDTEWAASPDTIYTGWVPRGVTGDTGDLITSGQSVYFHGAGGITTEYTASSNTLIIDGSGVSGGGTVTSVATDGTAITGGTITTTGTITHATSAGYKHIPSGGSSGQFLKYSSSGTAVWAAGTGVTSIATTSPISGGTITGTGTISHVNTAGYKHIPSGGSSAKILTYSSSGTAVWAAPAIDTSPVNGQNAEPISSNWAYDHIGDQDAHHMSFSDDRIKTNVNSMTSATNTIKALNPISYRYIPEWREAHPMVSEDIVRYGFLTSQFATVFPDFVNTTDKSLVRLSDGSHEEISINAEVGHTLPEGATVVIEDIIKMNPTVTLLATLVASIKELEARLAILEAG